MPSKIKRCMDLLEFIPEPSEKVMIKIAKEVGCSSRTAYSAKARIKKNLQSSSEHLDILVDFSAKVLKYVFYVRTRLSRSLETRAVDMKMLDKFYGTLTNLRIQLRLDEKGRKQPESDYDDNLIYENLDYKC